MNGWTFWKRIDANGGDRHGVWQNFWLHCAQSPHKKNFYLAWNGERFAENHDLNVLREHEPEILTWVEKQIAHEDQTNKHSEGAF